MNVDDISEWQWRTGRQRWKCALVNDEGAWGIVTMDGFFVCRADSEETAEYIVGLHNARFTPCLACGGYHDSLMRGRRSDSKGAPGDDRPPGCGIPPRGG